MLISVCIAAASQSFRNEWIDYSKTYYKFKIAKTGLYRIGQSQLETLGIGAANAQDFKLWRNGTEVALYASAASGPLGGSDYLEFWALKNDGKPDVDLYLNPSYQCATEVSLFTDTASYFLTVAPGSNARMVGTVNDTVGHGTAQPYCIYNRSYVWDASSPGALLWGGNAYYTQGEYVRSAAFDRGEGWQSGRFNHNSYPLTDLKAYTAGPAMNFTAAGDGRFIGNRRVTVSVNDSVINQLFSFGIDNFFVAVANIPLSRLNADATTIKFQSSDDSTDYGKFSLAKYNLEYPRKFDFDNASNVSFTLPANPAGAYLVISNFDAGGADPILYDLTNKKRYSCFRDGDSIKVKLQPSAVANNCVLISNAGANVSGVNNFLPRNFINFATASNQSDFLIIANRILNSGANNQVEAYRSYRVSAAGGGYNAKIFDIDELADQFAFGISKHSISIRNFLRYARATFNTAPKFTLLIGRGVNYEDYYANQSLPTAEQLNQVPTWGNPGSDNLLSSPSVNSPTPATPIGRISVVTSTELKAYLDKVVEFEALQQNNNHTQAGKDYTKQVLHLIGASDASTGALISPLMENYRKIIIDTLMGADVHSYIKANNPNLTQSTAEVAGYINNGVSLLTYFGHSSASSLDFNLNNPGDYTNNGGKYPVFVVNGCNAGNFFSYDENRLSNNSLTISEKFTLAPSSGAIAFIASTHFGVLNTLDYLTEQWYKAACRTRFSKSLGEIQQKAIESTWAQYNGDFLTRLTVEETTIHGDPSLKLFPYDKPDYSVELQNITYTPSFISSTNDSFRVRVVPFNLGRASDDSVWLRLQRQFPDGSIKQIANVKIKGIRHTDTLTLNVPIVGNRDKGINYIIATIDPDNLITEISEANNTATKPVEISDDEIRPVYPYDYSIVAKTSFKLYGSTADPFEPSRTYRMQADTTEKFNSPLLATQDVASAGGLIEFNPTIALTDGIVYYWRLAPVVGGSPVNWSGASFLYNPSGTNGFNQSHLYQHLKSTFDRIVLDSLTGKYGFKNRINNLFITHSKYPESGTEDGHFSISVNGALKIRSACTGHSIIFNVFDTVSFNSWYNYPGGLYNSRTNQCVANTSDGAGRQYNFEYEYNTPANRKQAMDFMDQIPNGYYVAVRLILDNYGDNYTLSYANTWKGDTASFGSGNSLYHKLYNQGAKELDSVNGAPRIWAFVYRKNDSTHFRPHFRYSQGLYDRITESVDCPTIDTAGYITSPKFGPAKAWQQLHWRGASVESINSPDSVRLSLIGITATGAETVLYNLGISQPDLDISSVSATTYPYIKLRLYTQDLSNLSPWQLDYWRLNYLPVPEGAVAPNLYYTGNDSATVDNITQSAKYKFGVAFKNVSDAGFDSLKLKLKLTDNAGIEKTILLPKVKNLPAGDTANVYFEFNADTLSGTYNLYLDINPDNEQPEQFHFNNYLYKSFVVYRPDSTGICPGLDKSFFSGDQAAGNTYQWQVNTGSGYVNVNNGGVYSGVNADSLKLKQPPTSWYGYRFRCAITNNAAISYSPEYKLKFAATWTGGISTAWENPANWGCGKIPDQFTDVYIKSDSPNYPLVNSNASCRSLRVMPGTTLQVTPGFKLDLTGPPGN